MMSSLVGGFKSSPNQFASNAKAKSKLLKYRKRTKGARGYSLHYPIEQKRRREIKVL